MLNNYTRYNNYTKKNRKDYNKVFSNAKFKALTAKRNRLAEAAR
jgi:hypothetical protein